jgi:endoglucanase
MTRWLAIAIPAASLLAAGSLAACSLAACGSHDAPTAPHPQRQAVVGVRVAGNRLTDPDGLPIRLRGVDHSGTEFACAQGWGIFDGPSDSASVRAMASWKINVVRVPLNETCWLGINGVPAAYGGANYRNAIADYVALLNHYGLNVILELHWSGPDTVRALGQHPMPDRDHSPEFWRQVATAFGSNAGVLFDLFNEPYPDSNADSPEAWRCWRDGGSCAGVDYPVAGMQELVDAVRGTGATNVIMLGGVQYSATLSQWLSYAPTDPRHNLAASWHVYNFSYCNTRSCWDATAAPVARQVPLILGELGESDGGNAFVTSLMDWMDAANGSYLAWTWNTWHDPLDLISSYDGTPTPYGQVFKRRFGA